MLISIDNYKYARKIYVFSSGNNINTEKIGYCCDKYFKNPIAYFFKIKIMYCHQYACDQSLWFY